MGSRRGRLASAAAFAYSDCVLIAFLIRPNEASNVPYLCPNNSDYAYYFGPAALNRDMR